MVKGLKVLSVDGFTGVDTFTDATETRPDQWVDALNVVVSPSQNAIPLRSPANFNTALSTNNRVVSADEYDRKAGAAILFDINTSSGSNVATYATSAGGVNTLLRSGQADAAWDSLNVNDRLFRVNGSEFIQYATSLGVYAVGITKPAAAPTLTITAGGTLSLSVGVTGSYAYINTGLGDVGECSAVSAASGPTTSANSTLGVTVVASAQTGINGIVLFLSQNAGSVRYLVVDANGDPIIYANTSHTISLSTTILQNLNVQETFFNAPPVSGATFLFKWRNRVCACGFTSANLRGLMIYSGFDQIQYGTPWATYPPLNAITIPSKSEALKCGTDTPIGALLLSDRDAYLLNGSPTDKVDSGENVLQVTEQLQQLGWAVGTLSPKTLTNTQYGTVWLDQNLHLQFWPWQGPAQPICQGIWEDLETIQATDAALAMARAVWFQVGKNGGFYVLTASTSGSTNNRMWMVTMIQRNGQLLIAPVASDIAAQCVFIARLGGTPRCFIGITDRLREILDFDVAGAGWPSGTELYFDYVTGNQLTNFSRFHSMRADGTRTQDALFRVENLDETESVTLQMNEEGGSYFGMVDRYAVRHRVSVNFPNDDTFKREIKGLRMAHGAKGRVI